MPVYHLASKAANIKPLDAILENNKKPCESKRSLFIDDKNISFCLILFK